MAKLTGAKIAERRKELEPARLRALALCQLNPRITNVKLSQTLKEEGFEVAKATSATWLARFTKPSAVRNRKQKRHRLAFKLWEENRQITAAELQQGLKEKGFVVHEATCYRWLKDFREGKGVGTSEEKPVTTVEPGDDITLEQIIKAAGSVESLSLLFYQGVMRELARKDDACDVLKQESIDKDKIISNLKQELDEVTRERDRMMIEYNEKLAKLKVGAVTLDETTQRLVPKA